MAQAIFGLSRHVIQKILKIAKNMRKSLRQKMGSKLSLRFGGRKCSERMLVKKVQTAGEKGSDS